MRLTEKGILEKKEWLEHGWQLPDYDRDAMRKRTAEAPVWIHFGGGNIFRVFVADIAEEMLKNGSSDRGVIVASGEGSVRSVYRKTDDLCAAVTLHPDGSVTKKVLGCVAASCITSGENADTEALRAVFRSPSLQLASFTITEKGYRITDRAGEYLPEVKREFEESPEKAAHYMGLVTALLLERFRSGAAPMALVSMDNLSRNGEKLAASVLAYAENWAEKGLAPAAFPEYVRDSGKISFPWTMIDKITPSPSPEVRELLVKDGLEDLEDTVTERGTRASLFANGEEAGYLVIEDSFPNGRPPFETAGVIMTDRHTVDRVEQMKVCACLNPVHTGLAVFGCLLGYRFIRDEMKDPLLRALAERIGDEGIRVVEDPGILDPKEFLDTVLGSRFPNAFIPDSPQRIATDTSQKIPVRYGRTLRAYRDDPALGTGELTALPLVFAGYLRYLTGVDDEGNAMELSPDPRLEELTKKMKNCTAGSAEDVLREASGILNDETLFGLSLAEAGLDRRVAEYAAAMMDGRGAVRRVLKEVLEK